MRPARLFAGPASLLLAVMLGCASAPKATPPVTPVPAASPLAGNWLLSGSLPSAVPLSPQTPYAAATFDVVGQTVTASASFSFVCGNSGLGVSLGAALTGTIQTDGSFVLTLPVTNPASSLGVTLSGHIPTTSGAPWAGTYTVTETNFNTCTAAQLTGSIAATPIADFTGTWAGKGSYLQFGSVPGPGTSLPISMTLALAQGAPIATSGQVSHIFLSGSLQVSGFPCFSKGTVFNPTTRIPTGSLVEGSKAVVFATMDDGSTVQLELPTQDVLDSKLALTNLFVPSGTCAGSYLFSSNPLILQKQ